MNLNNIIPDTGPNTHAARSPRAALNYIGKLLKAKGWSKHGRAGLQRRKELRPQRRRLLSMTFSRQLMKRLHHVTGNA